MANNPKILVLGVTGQVGNLVVQHLKNNHSIEVIAAARTPEKAQDIGVPVVRLDLDKVETIETALKGIDRAVDIEDVAAVSLLEPEKHNGQTYRLGYEAATYDDIADIFTKVIGQPFSYEARPPEEFYRNVLAAGAEPAYMKCVFDSYTELTNGVAVKPDEVFDNLPSIIGRQPRTLADFAEKQADVFRY
jgi:uncharacterized protein YbjT (DUF2867 family)